MSTVYIAKESMWLVTECSNDFSERSKRKDAFERKVCALAHSPPADIAHCIDTWKHQNLQTYSFLLGQLSHGDVKIRELAMFNLALHDELIDFVDLENLKQVRV